MESICNQIRELAKNVPFEERENILARLYQLYTDVETQQDARSRIQMRLLESVVAAVGNDLQIFRLLAESETPLTTTQLAEKANASPDVEGRILRYLASVRYIQEVGEDAFTANSLTRTLACPEFSADTGFLIDGGGGATFAAIPSYFRSNGYQEPADGEHCVFQQALNTDLPVQEWLRSHPEFAEYYDRHLDGYYESVNPFESYSLHELAANTQSDRAFFIGIGDATGKQSRKVKSLVPAARVVLQATSRQLEGLQNTDQGIELCPQDYLQEQKIKGARVYCLRNILQNHSDEECLTILGHIADAMAEDSVLLIDETAMPTFRASQHATYVDVAKMCLFGSKRRTLSQWRELVANAGKGLTVTKNTEYYPEYHSNIIEVVKSS